MKRVAIFVSCDSFEGFYGGTFGLDRETYLASYRNDFVWDYAVGLQKCGHAVFIYILSYGEPELRRIAEGLCVRFLPLPSWLRAVDALLYRARNLKYGVSVRDHVAHLAYGRALHAALSQDRVDVIYHQEIWTPRFDIVTQATQVPVVGADQGAVYADWMGRAKQASMKRAARVLCQSAMALERANGFGAEAVLMYNGVDTDFFMPPVSGAVRSRTVLTVGRLVEKQKRFSDLLHAIRSLPDFKLIIVGSGPDEVILKSLATELDVTEQVEFAGFVSDRDVLRRLYQECGVFVSTSAWEAVALVVLEAMSCAAPIVVTRIPSFQDLVTDGTDGLLVPVGSPDDVSRAIRLAFDSQQALGAAARGTVVARYSARSLYHRLSALFESI